MDAENQSAASDVSEQPAPQGEVEQSKETAPQSFAARLLAEAVEDGYDVGMEPPKAEEVPVKEPEAITADPDPEPEPEQKEPEAESPPQDPEVQKPEGDKEDGIEPLKTSIEESIRKEEAEKGKADWRLYRIAEQTEKLKVRGEKIEAIEAELSKERSARLEAEAQLQRASAPRPTPQAPLSDVYDMNHLATLKEQYEEVKRFTDVNIGATEDVPYGKDKDGEDIYLTPKQIGEMRYRADRALREDIPMRAKFLADREKEIAKAVEIYPEFKDDSHEMTKQAVSLLKQNPMLESILGPQTVLWIGRALKGLELEKQKQNGNDAKPAVADAPKRIAEAAKTKIAPTTPKSRSFTERRGGANLAELSKKLEETGSDEAAAAFLEAKLNKRRALTGSI